MWQLERSPLIESAPIDGTNPLLRIIETNAWKAEGIPPLTIGYVENAQGIEIVRLVVHAGAPPTRI